MKRKNNKLLPPHTNKAIDIILDTLGGLEVKEGLAIMAVIQAILLKEGFPTKDIDYMCRFLDHHKSSVLSALRSEGWE